MKRKTMTFPDVGINSLEDLTKAELIECLKHIQRNAIHGPEQGASWVNHALCGIAENRREKQLKDMSDKEDRLMQLVDEYHKLLAPYADADMKIGELPADVIQKGAELERKIRKAKEAYFATL